MTEKNSFWYEMLDGLIGREGLSRSQVARRAGVPSKTITSWVRGDVQSPRRWQPLARVLATLQASTVEANQVLQGAGHPAIPRLAARAGDDDRALLAGWLQPDVPFMPPDRPVEALVGRQAELAEARTQLQRQRRCVLLGMAGVGKTALAVELAHDLRHDYPDGVFWGELRTGAADAVLESWGQACGVPLERLSDFGSRAAAMRAVFARKQALIVLDDVVDGREALQMMPAQNLNCAVLVTTRSADVAQALTRRQPELTVPVEPMAREHSLALLESILGERTVAEREETADEIAALLGDMPLALHICGALCADTGLTLAQMALLLRDLRTRLEHLRLEEKPLVRLAFEQSWALLAERTRQAFATLAVFAGRPFATPAFAATAELSEPEAALLLTQICRRSLLTLNRKGRGEGDALYQQHTLLAAFAAEKLGENDPAWRRFGDYFGQVVGDAGWWRGAAPETWGHVMAGMATAQRLERWPLLLEYATHLSEGWRRQGYYGMAREGLAMALEAAQEMGDAGAEADIRLEWGRACLEQSDYEPARKQLHAALALFIEQGRTAGLAAAHYHLSRVAMEQSRYEEAEAAVQQAYRAYQEEEDVQGMGRALYRLGNVVYFRGDYERAAGLAQDAIRSQQQAEDLVGLLRTYRLATLTYIQLERIEEAARHCRVAAQLVERLDDRAETAAFYYTYADVLRQQGAFPSAHTYAHRALALFREMADGSSEANALLLLAGNETFWNDAEPARRQYEAGLNYCRSGLAVCEAVGYELGKPFLLLMQGRLLAQKGDTDRACATWAEALELAEALQHVWLLQRLQQLRSETRCGASPAPSHPSVGSPAP